jgi:hypothetical protein
VGSEADGAVIGEGLRLCLQHIAYIDLFDVEVTLLPAAAGSVQGPLKLVRKSNRASALPGVQVGPARVRVGPARVQVGPAHVHASPAR